MIIFFIIIFIFGLIIGSFLNCLIWRLYKEETVLGRSYCPKCKNKISWYDNIPILSFFILKRKCRYCNKKISWQYPLIELFSAILFCLAFYFNINNDFSIIKLFFDFLFISIIIIIFVFDYKWFLIPIQVLIFSSMFFLGINLFFGFSIWQILLSVVIGSGFFALQYLITRGKGLGEGDIWLGGFLGIIFPVLNHLFLLLLLTYMIGGFTSILLIIFGLKKIGSKIPLGIFLSVSAIITLFWAENIINWFTNLYF